MVLEGTNGKEKLVQRVITDLTLVVQSLQEGVRRAYKEKDADGQRLGPVREFKDAWN